MSFAASNKTLRTPPQPNNKKPSNGDLLDQTEGLPDDSPTETCLVCNLIHTGDGMVSCYTCARWFHFKCVNETPDVEHRVWDCAQCLQSNRTNANEPEKHGIANKTSSKKSSKLSRSSKRSKNLLLQKLDEERIMKEKRDKEERERQELRDKEYLDKKYAILEAESTEGSSEENETDVSLTQNVEKWLGNIDLGSKNNQEAETTFVKHPNLAHSSFIPTPTVIYTGTKPKQTGHKPLTQIQHRIKYSSNSNNRQ